MPSLQVAIDARGAVTGGNQATAAMDRVKRSAGGVTKALGGIAVGFAAAFAVRKTYRAITSFETGLVGVGKTTDITGVALDRLGEDFIKLSLRMPIATRELLDIGQAAGQLGVSGAKNIITFTEAVAKLGVSSELRGEQAATVLARMLNITGESVASVGELASVMVALGNSMAANEPEIAHIAMTVAQSTVMFDIGSAKASALGAAMADLGVRAQLGGSAVGRAFRAIDAAIRGEGRQLQMLAEMTGTTEQEITRIFRDDAVAGFQLFLEGLGEIISRGGDATETLDRFGLSGEELLKVLPTLAKNSDRVARALRIAGDEAGGMAALNEEAARAFGTLASSITLLGNTIAAALLGRTKDSTKSMAELVNTVTGAVRVLFDMEDAALKTSDASRKLGRALKIVAAILAAIIAMKVADAFWAIGTAIKAAAVAAWDMNGALFPILATLAAIGVAVAALEFGRHIFNESQIVQGAMQDIVTSSRKAWEMMKFGAKASFAAIGAAWDSHVLGVLKGVRLIIRGMAQVARGVEIAARIARRPIAAGSRALFAAGDAIGAQIAEIRDRDSLGAAVVTLQRQRNAALLEIAKQDRAARDAIKQEFEDGEKGLSFVEFLAKDLEKLRIMLSGVKDEYAGLGQVGRDAMGKIADSTEDAKEEGRKLALTQEQLATMADGVGQSFGRVFEDMIFDAQSAGQAIEAMIRDITRLVFQQVVVQSIARGVTGALGGGAPAAPAAAAANGMVFSAGNVVPFAGGGIVSGPTSFPMSGGRRGLMGEAGPEAIMPLARGADGKLGIAGGKTVNVTMNITTPDAASFRRSQKQIAQQARRQMGGV